MEPSSLDFQSDDELLGFFRKKKTEISCINQPHIFLSQLRDHDLVQEDVYKKVNRMKSQQQRERMLYQILDRLETDQPHRIRTFWECVFKPHILQRYPELSSLRDSLMEGQNVEMERESMVENTRANSRARREETVEESQPHPSTQHTPCQRRSQTRSQSSQESTSATLINPGSSIQEGGMREIQPGPSTQRTPVQRRPQRQPHTESNRSPSQNVESDAFWKKRFLPVNCGNEEGILDKYRLAKGQDCIRIRGNWVSPSKFEKCGGRASSRKWKESIRCKNITLQQLIQEGHLEYSAQKRRICPSRGPTMDSYSGEESDAESMDERESNDDVGMSASEDNCLSVTCGSASGTLHKDRFAREDRGRCIQTGNKWLTPEDFRKESTPVNFRSVKNIIMCQGVSLSSLIEQGILKRHSLLCECDRCTGETQQDQGNDDFCFICADGGELVCCDQCPRAFHPTCHLPEVEDSMLNYEEIWVCTYCLLKEQSMSTGHMSLSQAQGCCISDYMLHCQYLLMNVYKADKQHSIAAVFSTNPCNIKDYEKVIKRPMWLNKIAENLQFEKYSSVGQFASDIKLIFDNCSIFNKGKEIEKKGDQLYTLFKNEFKKLFNIQE
ncbi:hypothetical protein AGOR_G00198470 [Albula goreensis]|uniref:Nuclear body protein SP140-like protein n=1 Tax=Albula goreensis TaxID=1534307 RepID=A0A8T3CW66_9TELE|nr:hypothetical protein AGOR_G00198470 [Albula goreensis]